MDIGSTITGLGTTAVAGVSLYDRKNKKFNKDNAQSTLISGVTTTGTGVIGASLNQHTLNQIHQKYASAYVESMSDAELELALVRMNYLAPVGEDEEDVKTR